MVRAAAVSNAVNKVFSTTRTAPLTYPSALYAGSAEAHDTTALSSAQPFSSSRGRRQDADDLGRSICPSVKTLDEHTSRHSHSHSSVTPSRRHHPRFSIGSLGSLQSVTAFYTPPLCSFLSSQHARQSVRCYLAPRLKRERRQPKKEEMRARMEILRSMEEEGLETYSYARPVGVISNTRKSSEDIAAEKREQALKVRHDPTLATVEISHFKPPRLHIINELSQAEFLLQKIQPGEVISFDMEWVTRDRYEGKTSLAQLATVSDVFLLQLSRMPLPTQLSRILADPSIIKCGANIIGDAQKYGRDFDLEFRGLLDLTHLARAADRTRELKDRRHYALRDLCRFYLHRSLAKSKLTQVSAWDRPALDPGQVEYAACDVYVGIEIVHALLRQVAGVKHGDHDDHRKLFENWRVQTVLRNTLTTNSANYFFAALNVNAGGSKVQKQDGHAARVPKKAKFFTAFTRERQSSPEDSDLADNPLAASFTDVQEAMKDVWTPPSSSTKISIPSPSTAVLALEEEAMVGAQSDVVGRSGGVTIPLSSRTPSTDEQAFASDLAHVFAERPKRARKPVQPAPVVPASESMLSSDLSDVYAEHRLRDDDESLEWEYRRYPPATPDVERVSLSDESSTLSRQAARRTRAPPSGITTFLRQTFGKISLYVSDILKTQIMGIDNAKQLEKLTKRAAKSAGTAMAVDEGVPGDGKEEAPIGSMLTDFGDWDWANSARKRPREGAMRSPKQRRRDRAKRGSRGDRGAHRHGTKRDGQEGALWSSSEADPNAWQPVELLRNQRSQQEASRLDNAVRNDTREFLSTRDRTHNRRREEKLSRSYRDPSQPSSSSSSSSS